MTLGKFGAIVLTAGVVAAALGGRAEAGPIYFGTGWSVPFETALNPPAPGSTPGPGAVKLVEFTSSAVNFSTDCAGCYNLIDFLSSEGFLLSHTYFNGANDATDITSTLWEVTGTALFTNGQTYLVRHDDGIRLWVNGAPVFENPSPGSPILESWVWGGATGVYAFDFVHANAYPNLADFQVQTFQPTDPVPEPATLTLFGTGLLAVVRSARRRQK